ncbi:MAG: sulfite exporter TauE/SafE family protein [Patescibacteria group bacterium]
MENTNLFVIFLTGLITGGLTCLAVQGGLLASTISQREQERLQEGIKHGNAMPILYFLLAKLIAYTILGFLLGWFGSLFTLSVQAQSIMLFVVAIFMIGTALNLLNVHPFFRHFALQPPKFLTRLVRNQSKSKDVFAPALLGAFTVFIPCGTTQAMMALAIATGNPLTGAAILFAFVAGTAPLFFILGYFATKLGDAYQKRFFKVAGVAILLLALYGLKGAFVLSGVDLSGPTKNLSTTSDIPQSEVTITIQPSGYSPRNFSVKAGSVVIVRLNNTNAYSCAQAFTIPKLGIQRTVAPGQSSTVTFVAPTKPGKLTFACSMGMYTGTITII